MLKKSITFILAYFLAIATQAQYPPQAGIAGSDALSVQDNRIVAWATAATIQHGWKDIADTTLGKTTIGGEDDVVGPVDVTLASLGDGGSATLTFDYSLRNGPGPDFAVFENGFTHLTDFSMAFLELAFVEVSSDGENFVRFPAVSLSPTEEQYTNDDFLDASYLHNLAGKYINGYGTPFDLEELKETPGLDVNAITHVRVVDVVGSIDPEFAQYDSQGNAINDPYPTPFAAGGFDLHGVAVLNSNQPNSVAELGKAVPFVIYPNPAHNSLTVLHHPSNRSSSYIIIDVLGKYCLQGSLNQKHTTIDLSPLRSGVYWIRVQSDSGMNQLKFIKVQE